MEVLAQKCTSILIQKGIASETDRNYFNYCFEIMISTILEFGAVLLIAMVSHCVPQTICFLLGLWIVRCKAGGYHADTNTGCFILLLVVHLSFLLIIHSIPSQIYIWVILLGSIFSCITIYAFAPVEHVNRPISKREYHKFKRESRILISVFTITSIGSITIFPHMKTSQLLCSFTIGVVVAVVSIFPAIFHSQRKAQ